MSAEQPQKKPLPIAAYGAAVVVLLIGVIWAVTSPEEEVAPAPTPIVKMPEPVIEPEPVVEPQQPEIVEPEPELAQVTLDQDMEPEPEPELPPEPEVPPHPPLMESDSWLRAQITDLVMGAPAIKKMVQENIISNFVVFVDNAAKGEIVRNFSPATEPEGRFKATLVKNNDPDNADLTYVLDKSSYKRFDMYADLITALPVEQSRELYETVSPLIEEAYSELGYTENDFDDKLIETIDLLLATPVIDGDIKLVTPSAMYEFADKNLEALSPIQKLFIRMGPDNQRKIIPVLKDIKAQLQG